MKELDVAVTPDLLNDKTECDRLLAAIADRVVKAGVGADNAREDLRLYLGIMEYDMGKNQKSAVVQGLKIKPEQVALEMMF